jgi:hypothetical protein
MITIISYTGMLCCLISVIAANSHTKLRSWFNAFVAVGGVCLTIYAISIVSIPFIILNGVYGSLGIYNGIKEWRRHES